jgi:hypothetical protein
MRSLFPLSVNSSHGMPGVPGERLFINILSAAGIPDVVARSTINN